MQYELQIRWVNGANMRRFRARELRGPADIAQITRRLLGTSRRFCVLHIDRRGRVIGYSEASGPGRTNGQGCLVDPRVVFRSALDLGAVAVIVAHCHRSGDPMPTRVDLEVTRRLMARGDLVGVQLLDHVIAGDRACVSLLEWGLL